MGDGSIFGIQFYWSALFIKLFGFGHTMFALRLSIAILSVLSLISFYFLLRQKTSLIISLIFTILLSSNYVFLNFSRTAWVNMGTMFSGLFLLLFLEMAERKKRKIWYLLAGITAGITLYGYHYGKILVISITLYLLLTFLNFKNINSAYIKRIGIFLSITLAMSLPFIASVASDQAESVLRRPKSTYVFSPKNNVNYLPINNLFYHQIEYTLRGFITLDKSVMSEGIENQRYLPKNTSPVNLPIKLLFIPGIAYALFFRWDLRIWWIIFTTILLTQILTKLPPNFSRGLFYIPFIYFISALFLYEIWKHLKRILFISKYTPIFTFMLIVFSILLCFKDIGLYFKWMTTKDIYTARQPAIDYKEFDIWQNYQIQIIKNGLNPITNYDWYQIRPTIFKNNFIKMETLPFK